MNVLHISSAKSWRGGERQVAYLIEGLSSAGSNSFLLSPKGSALSKRISSRIKGDFIFKNGALGYVGNLFTLKKICQNYNIDIVHAHDSHSHTLLWFAYRFGFMSAKSVVTRRLNNPIKKKSIGKYNYHKIERIICVSDAVRDTMRPKIDDEDRLITIHSSIDVLKGGDARSLPTDKTIYIGYVAAFTKEKDHEFFIDCALEILKINDRFRFILTGDGPLKDMIEKRVGDYKEYFEFTGFVDDVEAEYAKMDLIIHTAKSEALGTAILDGMKFGLPIVARDVGGVRELVNHGENGYLVSEREVSQVVDSVLSIIDYPDVYNNMSIASLRLVKRFDKREMNRKIETLYREILS